MDDFISEINMLKLLNTHVNVVKLIGHTIKTKPYLMIMEFVACGDLESYLIGLREEWKNRSNRNKFEYVKIVSIFFRFLLVYKALI